jgi:hypothetical protein
VHFFDMVGVTGSIPVAPTINPLFLPNFWKALVPVGSQHAA